jgi:hypothetical protein
MRITATPLLVLVTLVALADIAFAQAPPTRSAATPAPSTNASSCVPHDTAAPNGTTTGKRAEPLGDKLAKSDGVLCPPAGVDPKMRAPTPEGGNTPVIPPPGSPGGDPNVRPK